MNAALLLGLLLLGHAAPSAIQPEDLAEETAPPAGLVTGPVFALAVGLPVVMACNCVCLSGPAVVAVLSTVCCAFNPLYAAGALALLLACTAPTAGCALVGFDLVGFFVGQGLSRTFNPVAASKAALEDVGNNRIPRPISGLFQDKGTARLRDAAVGAALAIPSILALVAAQVLVPLSCLVGCSAWLFTRNGATAAPGVFLNGWVLAAGVAGAAGVWWLFSALVVRPLLLMAVDAPTS